MSDIRDQPHSASGSLRPARSRAHLVYFALAIFDLTTVLLSLFLIDRISSVHSESVEVNQVWADRLADFSELRRLAAAVNAPGNDVFESRDVELEGMRLQEARDGFFARESIVRDRLLLSVGADEQERFLQGFDSVNDAMDAMVAESRQIFDHFRAGEAALAGARMAEMDRRYEEVGRGIAAMSEQIRAHQQQNLEAQAVRARSWRKYEYVIAGLIVIMVCGVTLYGHTLARRLKEADERTRRHLQAISESEARFRAVLASTLDPVLTIDSCGTIQSASESTERVFGWSPDELIGENIQMIMPEPHRSQHDAYLETYRRTGRTNILDRTREFEAVHKEGHSFPIEVSISRVDFASEQSPHFTGIVRDISERRRAEAELTKHRHHLEDLVRERTTELERTHAQLQQADRLASIGTLAAGLGHDMNNVLFPVRCRLDAIDQSQPDETLRAHASAVRSSIDYLQHLADGLHLLAMDPDEVEVSEEATHLAEWWQRVGPLLRKTAPSHAQFEQDLSEDLPAIALGPHRLTQAVLNLIVNAGEAIDHGGMIRLWARQSQEDGMLEFGVTDDGEGMAEHVRQHALDPFFTTKKRGLGTGLGLSLVHGVAQAAGGRVEIDSSPGKGTTVRLVLPVGRAEGGREARNLHTRVAHITVGDPRQRSMTRMLLTAAEFIVEDGPPESENDCLLWITDATEAHREHARQFLEDAEARIIALGARAEAWDLPRVVCLEWPVNFEELRERIAEVLT